jgi:hypothetical protein
MQLPNLSPVQIDSIEVFVASIKKIYPLINQEEAIASYESLLTEIPFETFWEAMKAGNIPQERPADFSERSPWEQIMWIRTYGLPTALKLIEQLKQSEVSDADS